MDRQKLLEAIIETAIDGIITMDSHGIIETMNPAALRLFGYQPDEVKGKNVSVLMPEPDKSAHDGYIHRYQSTGEKRVIGMGRDVFGLRKDCTTFPFRLGVSEVEYEDRKIFTGFIHDISKEKAAELDLKKYTEELEGKVKDRTRNLEHLVTELENARDEASNSFEKEKELNQLKTRFVSMASHEFRTPLSSVQLSASLIEKYLQINDPDNII